MVSFIWLDMYSYSMLIKDIKLIKIFDSVGHETIEATIFGDQAVYRASAAGGTSVSKFAQGAISPDTAINAFSSLKNEFLGDFTQERLDALLKKHINELGAQVTTAISLAFFSSAPTRNTFPNILGKVLGGGKHAGSRKTSIQEFLVTTKVCGEIETMWDVLKSNFEIWKEVRERLLKIGHVGLDYESGWTADIEDEKALDIISDIVGDRALLGVDMAATSFWDEKIGKYVYYDKKLSPGEQVDYVVELAKKYNLYFIEDPFEQADFDGFSELTKKLKNVIITGDDIIASSPKRLEEAVKRKAMSGVIVKPNQIGTITDCMKLIEIANANDITPVVSHRSGETCCGVVSKLAQLVPLAKFGIAGMRISKLNELLRLWKSAERAEIVFKTLRN